MDQKQQQEIKRYLSVIKRATAYIESMLECQDGGLFEQMVAPQPSPQPIAQPQYIPPVIQVQYGQPPYVPPPLVPQGNTWPRSPQAEEPRPKEPVKAEPKVSNVRKEYVAGLLGIDTWPEACPPFMTVKPSDQDQVNRANAVLDMMLDKSVEGMRFLDYGCGDGWIVQEMLNRGVSESWGYDVESNPNWAKLHTSKMCDNRSLLPVGKYFDFIMLYDVLDHCVDTIEVMNDVKNRLTDNGIVYVRCHPWTSKHATHLFKQGLNKAYIHLFLNWEEIEDVIKRKQMFTRMEKKPQESYHWWFNDFDIKKERLVKEPLNGFFLDPVIKSHLLNQQQIPIHEMDEFIKCMEIQFIDYRLGLKK